MQKAASAVQILHAYNIRLVVGCATKNRLKYIAKKHAP